MSITVTVENDTIKLPPGVHLPDGTQVTVEPLPQPPLERFTREVLKFARPRPGAPKDFATNFGHYLFGEEKR